MKKYGRGKLREAALDALTTPRKSSELAALLEISSSNASACLSQLKKQGEVKIIDGRYVATSVANAAAKRVQIAAAAGVGASTWPGAAGLFGGAAGVAGSGATRMDLLAHMTDRSREDIAAALGVLLGSLEERRAALEADRQAVLATFRMLGIEP